MKDKFYEYCIDIGISDTLLTQIKNMHSTAHRLLGEEIDAIFISDYTDQNDVRSYQSIYFFSKNKFAYFTLPNVAVCNVLSWRGLFPVMQTSFENYNFKKAYTTSKMRMVMATESLAAIRHNQTITFSASGINCDFLLNTYTEIILPHL